MTTTTLEIPDAVYRRARRAAEADGISFEAFALAAIQRAAPPPHKAKPAKKWQLPPASDLGIHPWLDDDDLKFIARNPGMQILPPDKDGIKKRAPCSR